MAYRSPSSRVGWASFAAASCAALVSLFVAGCQSNAQFDQVARELRMQEDELYALEDYLDQYQKLVCKYRAENAALKRQLTENGVTPKTDRAPSSTDTLPTPTGPSIDTPPVDGTPPPSEIDAPDIPPLETRRRPGASSNARRTKSRRPVKSADAQGEPSKSGTVRPIAFESVEESPVASEVRLHGEVVANEAGGGPRIRVDVEPLNTEGQATEFEGAMSLMLMAPNDEGKPAPIARWDYRPQEVRAAVDPEGHGKAIRFHLELPPETPAAEGTELWVRLLQRRGPKLLAHAKIKLQERGMFSSRSDVGAADAAPSQRGPDMPPVVATTAENTALEGPPVDNAMAIGVAAVSTGVFDGGWTIARPGQPAGIPKDDNANKSDWRATLELPPSVMASSRAAKPKPRVNRPRESVGSRKVAKAKTPTPAAWSPDRSTVMPAGVPQTASRPTWSATR